MKPMSAKLPADAVFGAIADRTGQEVPDLLADGDLTVNVIASRFPESRPAISQRLGVLEDVGLAAEQKVQRERYYRLQPEPLRAVRDGAAHYDRVR